MDYDRYDRFPRETEMAYAILQGPTLQHFLERSLADPASVKRQALAYLNLCTAQQSDECAA